jgi:hypothetical protein
MVKNIMFGLMFLFCMNMLFNKAAVIRLEREAEKLEIENIYMQEKLLWEEHYIDSLERVIIDLTFEYERN